MPSEDIKILKSVQFPKSDETPFIIYLDLESLVEKIDGCENNPGMSSTAKVGEHIPSVFLMSTSTIMSTWVSLILPILSVLS